MILSNIVSCFSDDKCSEIKCTKGKICVLNIQMIPICRCPSPFMCPKRKDKEVCGKDGVTYRSRCHLRISECTKMKKVRFAYKGPCKSSKTSLTKPIMSSQSRRRQKQNRLNRHKDKLGHHNLNRQRQRGPNRNRGVNKQRSKDGQQRFNKENQQRSRDNLQKIKDRGYSNFRNKDKIGLSRHRPRKYRTRRNKAYSFSS